MRKKLDEFSEKASALLSEPGILEQRPSWNAVKALATTLSSATDIAVAELNSEHSVVLILASSNKTSSQRDAMLKALFQKALLNLPSDNLIKLLSKLSTTELKDNLLPYIYDAGTRGSTSCYIAARLRVYVAPEAFQYFLSARTWNQTDLMNLSLIVRPEESAALCSHLETNTTAAPTETIRNCYSEFRYILFNHLASEPLLPDLPATETQSVPPAPLPAQTASAPRKPAVSIPEPATTPAANPEPVKSDKRVAPAPFPQTMPAVSSGVRQLMLPVALIILTLAALMLFSTIFFNDPMAEPVKPRDRARAPQFWVDAVSQRPVTVKFLSADKDYRMGELFLTRDRFAEALKLFEDALSIDSGHIHALLRSGYCRMKLGDHKKAAETFRKLLSMQPGLANVNLYLARIALDGKDFKAAADYYKAEYEQGRDLAVGMEYANFMAKQGNHNEAMELIAALQERFPDKMLVLSSDSTPDSGKIGEGSENE